MSSFSSSTSDRLRGVILETSGVPLPMSLVGSVLALLPWLHCSFLVLVLKLAVNFGRLS